MSAKLMHTMFENPDEQKYYKNFNEKDTLNNEQLNILFSEDYVKMGIASEENFAQEPNNISIF